MFKHIIMLIGLSVAAIYFQDQLMRVLQFFMYVHTELAKGLGDIFSVDKIGEVVQSVIALLLIPAVIGVVLALLHLFIRKHQFPHTMISIWVAWAVLLVSVLSQTGHVTNHAACLSPTTTLAAGAKGPGAPGVPGPGAPGPGVPGPGRPGAPNEPVTQNAQNAAPIPQQG